MTRAVFDCVILLVDLALAAQARFLVSRDKDLLDLMDDDTFCQRFPGLTVIDPVHLLRELGLFR